MKYEWLPFKTFTPDGLEQAKRLAISWQVCNLFHHRAWQYQYIRIICWALIEEIGRGFGSRYMLTFIY